MSHWRACWHDQCWGALNNVMKITKYPFSEICVYFPCFLNNQKSPQLLGLIRKFTFLQKIFCQILYCVALLSLTHRYGLFVYGPRFIRAWNLYIAYVLQVVFLNDHDSAIGRAWSTQKCTRIGAVLTNCKLGSADLFSRATANKSFFVEDVKLILK